MKDAGTDPMVIKDIINTYNFVEIVTNLVVSKGLLKIKSLADRFQQLLNDKRDINRGLNKNMSIEKINIELNKIEAEVSNLVIAELGRDVDIAMNLPMLTRIRNIFVREGLTIGVIAGAIGTIISTIFSIVFGTHYTAAKPTPPTPPQLGPTPTQPLPQSQPQLEPKPQPEPKPEPKPKPDTFAAIKKNDYKYYE